MALVHRASPAVSFESSVVVSATLTGANGNPIPNVDTTLSVIANSGSAPTGTSGGMTVTSNSSSSPYTYSIATDSSGVATAKLSEASGSTSNYALQFSAPYSVNRSQITDSTMHLQFANSTSLMIPPFGGNKAGYNSAVSSSMDETKGVVPVTVTLPELNGTPQANVGVAFTLSNAQSAAFLSTKDGSTAGSTSSTTTTVYTVSNGQATAYVNSNNTVSASNPVEVSASASRVVRAWSL